MRIILPIFLLLTYSIELSAQELNQLWSTELTNDEGAIYEKLNVVSAHENGTIVAGQSTSLLGYDMYVASYDNDGNLLWEEYIDTPNNSAFTHIIDDGAGNFYLMGYEILTAFFRRGVHVAKINLAGEILWHTTYKGPENINAWGKDMVLSDGKIHICGVEIQPDGFDSGFVAQFDQDGELTWGDDFHPEGFGNELTSLAVAPNGNVTAVGYSDAGWELYAIQYDSNGSLNWTFFETYDYEDEMWFNDIEIDADGNIYTMFTAESGFFAQSITTHRRNDNFDIIWEHIYDSGTVSEGLSISLGSDASVYSFIDQENNFDHYARIVKLDSDGNEIFSVADAVDDGDYFRRGILGDNDVAYVGVQALNFFNITSFSSSGDLLETVAYDESLLYTLSDMSVYGDRVVVASSEIQDVNALIINLNASDLTEQNFITSTGTPMPDVRPGEIATQGSQVWLGSYSDPGVTATYTITNLDPSGNVVWDHSITYPSVYPDFIELMPDENGNIIGLYENRQSLQAGYYGLIKLDSDGNEVFNVYVDDIAEYNDIQACLDNDGNSYVSGSNQAAGVMFLERYDPNGNLEWQVDYASPSASFPASRPRDMQYTDQGKIVIAGIHRGADEINRLHLFQYSNSGVLEWHTDVTDLFAGTYPFRGMEVDSNGDIIILGTVGNGYVAAKFSASGAMVWADQGSLSATQSPRSMCLDDAGNVYLCFSSSTEASFKKLDSAGNLVTENAVSANSSGSFYFPYKCAVINQQLVVLGDHSHIDFGIVSFQMVLNDNLETQYIAIDSTQAAQIESSSLDENGNFYGAYLSTDFDVNKSSRVGIVKKFSFSPLSTNDHLTEPEMMTIFPNPNNGEFQIALKLAQTSRYQISIRDIHGRLIHQFSPQQSNVDSNTMYSLPSNLSRGIYLVELRTEENSIVEKIVLE